MLQVLEEQELLCEVCLLHPAYYETVSGFYCESCFKHIETLDDTVRYQPIKKAKKTEDVLDMGKKKRKPSRKDKYSDYEYN